MKNQLLPSLRARRARGTGWVAVLAAAGATAAAQETTDFLTNQLPYPAYVPIDPGHYNLRWGRVTARLDGSVGFGFTDNRFYSEDDLEADYSIYPKINIGIRRPAAKLGVIMVIAVSCVKLLSAHNSTQHTSRKHKV